MSDHDPEQEPPPSAFTEDDPDAMRAVAERIAFRARRRILVGIALVVALCISLSYLGPTSVANEAAPSPVDTKAGNIP